MPPILVGGRSEAGMRRAARFGEAWMPMWLSPEQLARRAGRLAELAAERGRAAPRLALLLGVRVQDDSSLGRRHAAAHVHGQYRLEFERVERWTPVGGAGRIAEALAAYLAVGVEEFVLMPLGPDPLTQIERLAAVRAQLPEPQGAHA
jgi:alkanesulfonate monooxygenase SsuD/methylene tetrahydromethanopterin reductase-like flavin-dependent oxidoreductase (luciferase family)